MLAALAAMVATSHSALAASAPADVMGTTMGDDAAFGQDGIALGQAAPAPLFVAAQ